MFFPKDLWNIIKEYLLNYQQSHQKVFRPILKKHIRFRRGAIYYRWTKFPPPKNTNDMQHEYVTIRPRPNLQLSIIIRETNEKGHYGYWCGYGWGKFKGTHINDNIEYYMMRKTTNLC